MTIVKIDNKATKRPRKIPSFSLSSTVDENFERFSKFMRNSKDGHLKTECRQIYQALVASYNVKGRIDKKGTDDQYPGFKIEIEK